MSLRYQSLRMFYLSVLLGGCLALGVSVAPVALAQANGTQPALLVEVYPKPQTPLATYQPSPALTQALPQPTQALAWDELMRQVREHHPKVWQAALAIKQAQAKHLESQGAFDPNWTSDLKALRYNSSSKRGEAGEGIGGTSQVEMLTPYGVKVEAGAALNAGDVKSPMSATGEAGTYHIGVTVPLLRGARWNKASVTERLALLSVDVSSAAWVTAQLATMQEANKAYWQTWIYQQQQALWEGFVALADTQRQQVATRANAGDLPLINTTEAERNWLKRQADWVKVQQQAQQSQLALSLYTWQSPEVPTPLPAEGWALPQARQTPPSPPDDPTALEATLTQALQRHPQLQRVQWQRKQTEVEAAYANNLRLPDLDLVVAPGVDVGGDSVGPVFEAGIKLTVPLRNRTAKGKILLAELTFEQLNNDQRWLVQQLATAWQQSLVAWRMTYQQYLVTQRMATEAQRLAEGERRRFLLGDGTLFLVNQRELDAVLAEVDLLNSEAAVHEAARLFELQTLQWL